MMCFYTSYNKKYKLVKREALAVDRIRLDVIVFTLGAKK